MAITPLTAEYRDHLSTVDEKGKRVWILPAFQKGKFMSRRNVVAYTLLLILVSLPFIHIHHRPLFLFDVIHRKFVLFTMPFWPQDFYLFGLSMLTFLVLIITTTSIFGRMWCGWACPQTIFLEFLFRRVEYWIEGDASKQRKLKAGPWNTEKIVRKVSKWIAFYIISFGIANVFLAYIIGSNELEKMVSAPAEHWGTLSGLLVFSGVFYFVFAYMREQVCLVVCPYGRLQGVLVDKYGMAVTYDDVRGEPRSKAHDKNNSTKAAAVNCVDCRRCVQVCPTGIDIRNGAQLECIQCTACIDACDDIMTRLRRPTGLIRLTTPDNIKTKRGFIFTRKMAGYTTVLSILLTVLSILFAFRQPVSLNMLRTPGQLYQVSKDNVVSNLYNFELLNKTFDKHNINLTVKSPEGATLKMMRDEHLSVEPDQLNEGEFMIRIPQSNLSKNRTPVVIEVWMDNKPLFTKKSTFIGPVQ